MHNQTLWLISCHSLKLVPFPSSHFCFILYNFPWSMLYLATKRKIKKVLHKRREKFYPRSGNMKCQSEMKGHSVHYTHLYKRVLIERQLFLQSERSIMVSRCQTQPVSWLLWGGIGWSLI